MRIKKALVVALAFFMLTSVQAVFGQTHSVWSPDNTVEIRIGLANSNPYYSVYKNGRQVIMPSRLGFEILGNNPILGTNLRITGTQRGTFHEVWEQVWGEERFVTDHHNELIVSFQEINAPNRKFNIIARAFNDGIGFRYEFPEQPNMNYFIITDEITEFRIAGNPTVWWRPSHAENSFGESLYRNTSIANITNDAAFSQPRFKNFNEIERTNHRAIAWRYTDNMPKTIATPTTLDMGNGLFLAIHEANLTDFASMTLIPTDNNTLKSELVPWSNQLKVYAQAPKVTPWRIIIIAEGLAELSASRLMLNLNPPNQIEDTSWIQPMKYMGIWWGMHLGTYSWFMGPNHGATTENVKAYMDFAAQHGFGGVLVEGWNVGWEMTCHDGNRFRFTEPYPVFDIYAVTAHARSLGIQLIGHHETFGAVRNYERQLLDAFAFYQRHGVGSIKTGYVDRFLDKIEWHDGQFGVRHHRHVIEEAVRHQITLNVHEPIKETGIRRTFPNLMTGEGARGQEWNAWAADGGNPPSHVTILPFTRLLAGPIDFTPGVFNFDIPHPVARVSSTIANQLALFVIMYSPLQMACDLPKNYKKFPALFQFIVDVPVDWQESRVLNATLGEYVTFARKDRNSENWYIGSVTNEEARELTITLDFLTPGAEYLAQIYADGPNADYRTNQTDYLISEKIVNSETVLTLRLAPGGGQAIRLIKQ